jgi:hypothetical protein
MAGTQSLIQQGLSQIPAKRMLAGGLAADGVYRVKKGLDKVPDNEAGFYPGGSQAVENSMMNKVAQVAPDKYQFLVKAAEVIRTSPFRTEVAQEMDHLIKKAGFFGAAGAVGGTALTGMAMSLAGDLYDVAKRGITKSYNFKNMMKENPDLKDLKPKEVQNAFAALHKFNPEFAGDPTVAGSFVRRQASLGEFDLKQLTDLVGARKNLTDAKKLQAISRPWETDAEKEHKQLQINKMKQEYGYAPGEEARKVTEHGWKGEEEKRRAALHEFDLSAARGKPDHQTEQKGLFSAQAAKAKDDLERAKTQEERDMAEEKYRSVLRALDITKRERELGYNPGPGISASRGSTHFGGGATKGPTFGRFRKGQR